MGGGLDLTGTVEEPGQVGDDERHGALDERKLVTTRHTLQWWPANANEVTDNNDDGAKTAPPTRQTDKYADKQTDREIAR
jgi:hypothetical protein